MDSVNVKVNWQGDEWLANLRKTLDDRLDEAADDLVNHVANKLSGGRRGDIGTGEQGPGMPPRRDTGLLSQSVFWWKSGAYSRGVGVPGVAGKPGRALTLEFGKTINAKHGAMAVPISPLAKKHSRGGGSARDFPIHLVPISRKGKPTLLVSIPGTEEGHTGYSPGSWAKNKGKAWIIHYVLAKSVTIPPHPFLRPSLDEMRGQIQEIFSR